jgi:hypothetical protein
MSAFNNNNTNLNNTTAGMEGRGSNLASSEIRSTGLRSDNHDGLNNSTGLRSDNYGGLNNSSGQRNNLEDTYDRSDRSGLEGASGLNATGQRNNLEDAYNRHQPGGQFNQPEGLATTGFKEPHTHSNIATTGADNLNYSGADADTRKIDQTNYSGAYSNTAGQDLNSSTNRTAGTGIPPVNTAEHVRRNAAEEAISGRHGEQNSDINDLSTSRGHHSTTGTGIIDSDKHKSTGIPRTGASSVGATTGSAITGDHGASKHNNHTTTTGLDNKAGLDTQQQDYPEQRHAGIPQHAGLAHGQNKHGDKDATDATTKASAGDKIKGNLEKLAGKITGDEGKVAKGENIAHGRV